jgi:DNA-binding HxlR family transcriptional regulator
LQNKSPRRDCTSRLLLDQLTTWAILVLYLLADGPACFNTLKRVVAGVSQNAQTQTLRGLERHGIVSRTVLATSPVGFEYALTPLGQSLDGPFAALRKWSLKHRPGSRSGRGCLWCGFSARGAATAEKV